MKAIDKILNAQQKEVDFLLVAYHNFPAWQHSSHAPALS
jgi:hypothetical protein